MRLLTLLLPTVLSVLPTSHARAEDWPEFRGPTGQGHVRQGRLPLEWGPQKNIVWKQAIPGLGWSSPVVVAGRVYLTTSVAAQPKDEQPNTKPPASNELSLRALCLDAATGKILWEKEVVREPPTAPRIHTKNSHASPTPLVHDGNLYVHFGHMGTACLDLVGNIVWTNTSLTYSPVHGNGGTPIMVDDLLVFSCDGGDKAFLVALDRATGKVRWQTDRRSESSRKFSFSTPLLISVKDRRQIISPFSDAVCAYDPATGKEIWRVRYDGYSVIPRPVYVHGLVFICTGYNTPSLLAIRPDGSGDVTATHVAWTAKRGVPHTASLLLVGEELYMVSDGGMASCLDARTGKVYWQERLGGNFSASPVDADGKVYFQSEDGVGTVIEAGREFKKLARNALGEKTLASYAVVDAALFLRTEKNLYRFEAR
jgi:outer membrane protein assembly factor BamB